MKRLPSVICTMNGAKGVARTNSRMVELNMVGQIAKVFAGVKGVGNGVLRSDGRRIFGGEEFSLAVRMISLRGRAAIHAYTPIWV